MVQVRSLVFVVCLAPSYYTLVPCSLSELQLQAIFDPVIVQNCLPDSACCSGLSSETSPSLGEDAWMLGGGVALGLPLDLLVQVIVDLVILQNCPSDSSCCLGLYSGTSSLLEEDAGMHGDGVALGRPLDLQLQVIGDLASI